MDRLSELITLNEKIQPIHLSYLFSGISLMETATNSDKTRKYF